MIDENELRVINKLQYFCEKQIKVHVKRHDKIFWNGIVVEEKDDGVFKFMEEKFGECLLFTCDCYDVQEYRREE